MYEAAVFDPNAKTSSTFNTQLPIGGKFIAFNESNVGLNLTFSDGNVRYLSAWTKDVFTIPTRTPIVAWAQKVILAGNTNPISQVLIEAYQPGEKIDGTYPAPIQHTSYIPNTVSTAFGGSTTLQNDSNVSGTTFIESTVAGSPGSNIIAQNQGIIQVLQWIGGVLTQIFKTDPGAASVVKLGNTNLTVEALGNMTVDQVLTAVGNTSLSTLLTSGLATLNSLAVTNNATVGGTLGVTGNTSMSTASTSGLATLNSASVTNNETVGGTLGVTGKATLGSAEVSTTLKVDTTSEFVGNVAFDANPILSNAVPLQSKDSGGTARTILQVDGSNNLQLFGITGLDLIQALDHAGNLATVLDLVHKSLDIKTTAVNLNGTTAGSAQLYMPFTGPNFKVAILIFNGYQNNTTTEQTIALPVAFSTRCMWLSGNGKSVTPYSGGSKLVGKASKTSGGVVTGGNTVDANWTGEVIQGFDALGLGTSEASQAFAIYVFVGI